MPEGYRATSAQGALLVWQQFQANVDPVLLTAPRIDWDQVNQRLLNYLNRNVAGTPWFHQLALLVGVSICHAHLRDKTAMCRLNALHCRWTTIFHAYQLTTFSEWDPAEHLVRYLQDDALDDSFEARGEFLSQYTTGARSIQVYLRSLSAGERAIYQQWTIPLVPPGIRKQLSRDQERFALQAQRRKVESDAVTPHFARIRGEAHLRWNELQRLRQQVHELIALVQAGQAHLPVSFSYEEPRRKLRLSFTLWDRPSFVLAHTQGPHAFSPSTVEDYTRARTSLHNHHFLEFVGADHLGGETTPRDLDALLWFGDLLRYDVMATHARRGAPKELEHKQGYLRSWGYEDTSNRPVSPFDASHPGLLAENTTDGTASFMRFARKRTDHLLFLVESLFAAATFGLAALDFFTTTGARMRELQQVNLSPDCLYTMEVGGTHRLLIRLVPKGADRPADYLVGPETRRNLEKVGALLKEHYHLQPGEHLPRVSFHPDAWLPPSTEDRPYLFQYNGKHLSTHAITACLRFLCHGMVFTSAEGKTIVLKAHLLRHVFATHLHQVEQVPLDVIAVILHQKNVQVTGYYAAPTWQQVVQTTETLLDRFATHLGSVEEAFVRAPAEVQRQYEEAKRTVGTLARVIGGDCTCHALCPISFACTGCVYKVPDPARREEILEQKQWAVIRLDQVKRRGMGPETVKMEALIQHCDTELEEMDLIEEYRRDETYTPERTIEQ